MKPILLLWAKLAALFGAVCLVMFALFFTQQAGYFDEFYNRIATSARTSLIVGTSRAAQGIVPDVLERKLAGSGFDYPILNFAFTLATSRYGQLYSRLIQKKLDANGRNGLFIVAVDPWCISSTRNELETGTPVESSAVIHKLWLHNTTFNPEYIIRNNRSLGDKLLPRSNAMYLHHSGWLEVTVPMDKASVAFRTKRKVAEYNAKQNKLDTNRLQALDDLVELLKQHGRVFLVRIPVGKELAAIENRFMPHFSKLMQSFAAQHHLRYIDFYANGNDFRYTDGNHLYKESSLVFSAQLADSILAVIHHEQPATP